MTNHTVYTAWVLTDDQADELGLDRGGIGLERSVLEPDVDYAESDLHTYIPTGDIPDLEEATLQLNEAGWNFLSHRGWVESGGQYAAHVVR